MKKAKVRLQGGAQPIIGSCHYADNPLTRLIGLLNHASLPADEGLLILPCKQVHTLFMRFPIDVVFLNGDDQIVGIESLKPWRFSKMYWKASKVLELASGTAQKAGLKDGERLEFEECSN